MVFVKKNKKTRKRKKKKKRKKLKKVEKSDVWVIGVSVSFVQVRGWWNKETPLELCSLSAAFVSNLLFVLNTLCSSLSLGILCFFFIFRYLLILLYAEYSLSLAIRRSFLLLSIPFCC